MMASSVRQPFIDATGLTEKYDFQFDVSAHVAAAAADGVKPTEMDMINILRAVFSEQLGLDIRTRKDTVEILVVESASKTPTEN